MIRDANGTYLNAYADIRHPINNFDSALNGATWSRAAIVVRYAICDSDSDSLYPGPPNN